MADFLSASSAIASLAGVSFKDAISLFRKLKAGPDKEYKEFISGIKKAIHLACKNYIDYCKSSSEHIFFEFVDKKIEQEITSEVQTSLDHELPYTIARFLEKETDLEGHEKRLLYHFVSINLNKSFEFFSRNSQAIASELERELAKGNQIILDWLSRIEAIFREVQASLDKIRSSWPVHAITEEWYLQRRKDAQTNKERYIKEYYSVSSRFNTMDGIICADFDCPNQEVLEKAKELIHKSNRHLFISGQGGDGKTSLMLRLAVELALEGSVCYWLTLSSSELTPDDMNKAKLMLDHINREAESRQTVALLFIDNLALGRKMVEALSEAWTFERKIRIVSAERTNHLVGLLSINDNKLKTWSDDAEILCLHTAAEANEIGWRQSYFSMPVDLKWKMDVVQHMINVNKSIDKGTMNYASQRVTWSMKTNKASVVEMLFAIYAEYNNSNKGDRIDQSIKDIKLAWNEWEELMQREFPGISRNSFLCIAALARIGMPVSAAEFARWYFPEKEQNFCELFTRYKDCELPLIIDNDKDETYMSPTHDMISDLYFEYHGGQNVFKEFMLLWDKWIPLSRRKADLVYALATWYDKTYHFDHPIVYDNKSEYDEALEWYMKAMTIREKLLGKEHLDTASTYNNIAGIHHKKGRYDKALEWYLKALAIEERVLGKEHLSTGTTYSNIAQVYLRKDEYDAALEWYLKDLGICEKELGKEHPYTATTYNNIAVVCVDKGEYEQALTWYEKALVILEKMMHPDTAIVYNNIATVYANIDKYEDALKWVIKAIPIFIFRLGIDHLDTKATILNARNIFVDSGRDPTGFVEWLNSQLAPHGIALQPKR